MKPKISYIVMGEDGHEYGPVTARQICNWVAEGRLEKKTPVKPDKAKDWVFLMDLPEFRRLFPSPGAHPPAGPGRKKLLVALVAAMLAVGVILFLKYFKHP